MISIYTDELRKSMQNEIDDAKTKIVDLVEEHNVALLAHDSDTVAAKAKSISELVEKIRQNTLNLLYDDCHRAGLDKESDEAARVAMMQYAVLHNAYTVTTIKETPVSKGSDLKKKVVDDRELYIDLIDLHKSTPGGIGADTSWTHAVTRLNMLMTIDEHIAIRLKDADKDSKKVKGDLAREVSDCYLISQIAARFDLGENPTSVKNMRGTLQKLADMMIGEVEWKISKKDVEFLSMTHCSAGKKPGVLSSVKDATMVRNIMGTLEKVLTQTEYEHDFQKKKEG